MKTIVLACSAGMSTSLLVTKIKQAADAEGVEINIYAIPEAKIDQEVTELGDNLKVLLLGPQVRYMLDSTKKKHDGKGFFIDVIDMKSYGMMDGVAVFNTVKEYL